MTEQEAARRYLWLREQHWFNGQICVVLDPKQALKLGFDCPSGDRLDTFIDEFMAKEASK